MTLHDRTQRGRQNLLVSGLVKGVCVCVWQLQSQPSSHKYTRTHLDLSLRYSHVAAQVPNSHRIFFSCQISYTSSLLEADRLQTLPYINRQFGQWREWKKMLQTIIIQKLVKRIKSWMLIFLSNNMRNTILNWTLNCIYYHFFLIPTFHMTGKI